MEGGDKAQLTNGSHYFASLQTCGGHAAGGWRLPPCSSLPGLPALQDSAPPGGPAACAAAAATCGAAPFNNSAIYNALLMLPAGGVAAQGNTEAVPYLTLGNTQSSDASWFARGGAFFEELNFTLAQGAPPLASGFEQLSMEGWGPRWLAPGAWRRVLWGAVPWAVGGGHGDKPIDLSSVAWWEAVALQCSGAPCTGVPRA